ncbi:hypothetical protein NDI56_05970 [Haloarcula sp. S1CR25-12]|uniref:DUF2178 domain-containing protein n=1 Tax=Haloarcula saliterrae TaxID=2950534 RepID=A0ABU2FB37_9EURY|nr:hypothetical protein [Haloarcula sp. S1CR25-12]MDS0258936.1 hypothetical protein [Haloarcula sp. S1CR25-12]
MSSSIGVGVAGLFAATAAAVFAPDSVSDLLLSVGVGVYYVGLLGYLVIWQRTGVRLLDEREAQIEQRACQLVVLALTGVTVLAVPADLLFAVTGVVDVPLALRGAVWGYALLLVFSLFVYGHVAEKTQ